MCLAWCTNVECACTPPEAELQRSADENIRGHKHCVLHSALYVHCAKRSLCNSASGGVEAHSLLVGSCEDERVFGLGLWHVQKGICSSLRLHIHKRKNIIPNSEKQKQLPNTQWMKYVYCPALFTLEVGRASCNHGTNTVWKKRFSKSVCDTVANMPEARAKGSLPKELLSASLFTSST